MPRENAVRQNKCCNCSSKISLEISTALRCYIRCTCCCFFYNVHVFCVCLTIDCFSSQSHLDLAVVFIVCAISCRLAIMYKESNLVKNTDRTNASKLSSNHRPKHRTSFYTRIVKHQLCFPSIDLAFTVPFNSSCGEFLWLERGHRMA